jgi:hypothetical protein
VPVAVFNNVDGADRAVLKRFGEPAWNNPVVRIVDAEEAALSERFTHGPRDGLARNLIAALESAKQPVPEYLRLLGLRRGGRATFSMHCFWTGEAVLGAVDGVSLSRTGWLNGREVVELRYDRTRVSAGALRKVARTAGFRAVAGGKIAATPRDDKYQLRHTSFRYLPLTAAQASRINAALSDRTDPKRFLSPRQRRLLEQIEATPNAGWPLTLGRTNLCAMFAAAEAIARARD